MYRIASRSFLTRMDRKTHNDISTLQKELSISQARETISFANVQHACSTLYAKYGTSIAVGSGSFITIDNGDLAKGFFLTAAHCVLKPDTYTKIDSLYITNPVTNEWVSIAPEDIFLDGAADIALIHTKIDLTMYSHYVLSLSSIEPKIGDKCYVCGNPGGFDNDSLIMGVVRDAHYALSAYIADAIHIDAPGIAGNSGSPIVNVEGSVIGLYVFGRTSQETFNGGPNLNTLVQSLHILKTLSDNKSKKYLGINWSFPNAYEFATSYTDTSSFPNQGIKITVIDTTHSPFHPHLQVGDLLLSVTINGQKVEVGVLPHQRTPGVLLYKTNANQAAITITFIRGKTLTTISDISFQKTYGDVPAIKDLPLIGGAANRS